MKKYNAFQESNIRLALCYILVGFLVAYFAHMPGEKNDNKLYNIDDNKW